MTDFDAAYDFQRTLAIRRRISGDDITDVGDFGFRQIATKVHASQMGIVCVRATGKVGHHGDRTIGNDANARFDGDRADKAGDAAQRFFNLVFARKAEGADTGNLAGLDFIEFVVATQ